MKQKCEKIGYSLEKAERLLTEAKNQIRVTNGDSNWKVRRHYLCENCGKYHLTSAKIIKQEIDKRTKIRSIENLASQICKQNKWDC